MKWKYWPDITLERYKPRGHPKWELTAEGARSARLYEKGGIVEVFSLRGGSQCAAFTSLQMWIHPYLYFARLPRFYHDRWIPRLAHHFAWACVQAAKTEGK